MKNKKTLVIILIVIVAFLGIASFRQLAQQRPPQQQDDPPTPIQLGVMTEKQRKHSKIIPPSRGNRNLLQQQGNVEEIFYINSGTNFGGRTPPPKAEYFRRLACLADSIVIARIISKDSQFTENQDFIFTDYELEIGQVLKNNSNLDIQALRNITLTVPGGSVTTGGRRISILTTRKIPLRVRGEYLLFLNHVPDLETYKLANERGIFGILNDRIIIPGINSLETADNIGATADLIRGVANNCLNNGGK